MLMGPEGNPGGDGRRPRTRRGRCAARLFAVSNREEYSRKVPRAWLCQMPRAGRAVVSAEPMLFVQRGVEPRIFFRISMKDSLGRAQSAYELRSHAVQDEPVPSGNQVDRPLPSFEWVYRRHVGYVVRLLGRFGVPDEETEDAAQEVFVIVHRRLAEYEPSRGSLKSWLFGIARGVGANRRRSRARRLKVVPAAPASARGSEPEQLVERREAAGLVRAFLALLSPEQRDVFELIEIEGLRGPEVAELLDVKLNTIYTRLRAARLAFKAYVGELRRSKGGDR